MIEASFWPKLAEVCSRLRCKDEDMLAVMMSESGVNPMARNNNGNAVGLIQFMPATLSALGFLGGPDAMQRLSATEQLAWVERYFKGHATQGLDSAARIYLFTFTPALGSIPESRQDTYVICGRLGPRAVYYKANEILDRDKNGHITVGDLKRRCEEVKTSAAWAKLMAQRSSPPAVYVPTWRDVQDKLADMGLYAGKLDGIAGPLTLEAIASALGIVARK